MNNATETAEGDTVTTIARDGAKMANCGNGIRRPIWTVATYVARRRTRDGVLTWRRDDTLTHDDLAYVSTRSGSSPSSKFIEEVYALTVKAGLRWVDGCRHGELV